MTKLAPALFILMFSCLIGFPNVLLAGPAAPGSDDLTVDEIIRKIDSLYRSSTSQSGIEMRVETPNWSRTIRMKVWTEGMKKTFVYVTYPPREEGLATLRDGTEMWNYFPKINKVMKVPPSMMMSSWMGSDFTNDDLVRESSMKEDYTARLIPPSDEDIAQGHLKIELVPREDSAIVWGKIIVTVRKSGYLPLKQEYYDERGTMARVMELTDIRMMGGRLLPATMELMPLGKEKKGHRTVVTYESAEFDVPLSGDVFTLRNLQRPR